VPDKGRVSPKKRALLCLGLMSLAVAMFLFMACIPVPDRPPTVDILSPEDGAAVVGIVTIEANVTDDRGVRSVTCSVDGESVPMVLVSGSRRFGLWEGYWDTTAIADGLHTITVTATDHRGQAGADWVIVVVDNVPPAPGSAEVQLRAEVVAP